MFGVMTFLDSPFVRVPGSLLAGSGRVSGADRCRAPGDRGALETRCLVRAAGAPGGFSVREHCGPGSRLDARSIAQPEAPGDSCAGRRGAVRDGARREWVHPFIQLTLAIRKENR